MYTGTNSIVYSQSFIGNLNPTVFTNEEPARTSLNTVTSTMLNAPMQWPWNRSIVTETLVVGQQDYTIAVANFGFLEKCSISYTVGSPPVTQGPFELSEVINTKPLGLTSQQGRPNAIAVQNSTPGTSILARFAMAPDLAYTATLIYQRAPFFWTATTQDWFTNAGIPYSMMDVFNALFLSEMYQFANDEERAMQYRQRGMAALLAKQDGLTQMQKNEILGQWGLDAMQTLAAQLKTQQAAQARQV